MQLNDFNFNLPRDLIARYALPKRSDSRLLKLHFGNLTHCLFKQISELMLEGDLLVFNDTKVIPARLLGKKMTGGRVEVLVERILGEYRILAQIDANKSPKVGDDLIFSSVLLRVVDRQGLFYELAYLQGDRTILAVIEEIGQIPLPPYLQRSVEENDKERYQTVYAKHQGAVAAPTAGLHFDEALLALLKKKGVGFGYLTLHVGAGTFTPVRVNDIRTHQMHAERIEVSSTLCQQIKTVKQRGGRIIAVGTTSMRALETASQSGQIEAYQGETNIFIYPGFQFNCVDVLITNFHLPCSSLLMLVCAFAGYQQVMRAYQIAIEKKYRFYSYGDAMWVEKFMDSVLSL